MNIHKFSSLQEDRFTLICIMLLLYEIVTFLYDYISLKRPCKVLLLYSSQTDIFQMKNCNISLSCFQNAKRDDSDIVSFSSLDGDVPRRSSYGMCMIC